MPILENTPNPHFHDKLLHRVIYTDFQQHTCNVTLRMSTKKFLNRSELYGYPWPSVGNNNYWQNVTLSNAHSLPTAFLPGLQLQRMVRPWFSSLLLSLLYYGVSMCLCMGGGDGGGGEGGREGVGEEGGMGEREGEGGGGGMGEEGRGGEKGERGEGGRKRKEGRREGGERGGGKGEEEEGGGEGWERRGEGQMRGEGERRGKRERRGEGERRGRGRGGA